jgi:hypothetical protein
MLPNGLSGAVSGVSFAADGIIFKGSEIGADYKWSILAKAFHFDPVSDAQTIQSLRANAPVRPQNLTNPSPWPTSKNERFRIEQDEYDSEIIEAKKRKKASQDLRQRISTEAEKISEILKDRCREVTEFSTHTEIFLTGGGSIHDFGNQLRCFGSDDEIVNVVKAVVAIAKSRWMSSKSMKLTGPSDFIQLATYEALCAGFKPEQLKVRWWQRDDFERACGRYQQELKNVTSQIVGGESAGSNDQESDRPSQPITKPSATTPSTEKSGDQPEEAFGSSPQVETEKESPLGMATDLGHCFPAVVDRHHDSRDGDVLKPASPSRRPRFR